MFFALSPSPSGVLAITQERSVGPLLGNDFLTQIEGWGSLGQATASYEMTDAWRTEMPEKHKN
ncbi:hypothetical protein PGT21_025133 [Puccinia graminis f. sp. tritici]|uniref:Uncharacterized protein n=1 Tax=Puccinia graminis f. sp. tritici TaxID=56615 RepID=A0A5B0NZE1_PUCGR|nr:hypothetical protein PGT21_025133 [Puccinia graminis f. sp. tritici]KAA1127734.1 hypothetical protein PGTUg99_007005 [Puccinia graminis f. sp. tritici]KAA1136729.1 hypothetical protein PGTUg99_002114 [Puccinia graminis f. sp. tritici]